MYSMLQHNEITSQNKKLNYSIFSTDNDYIPLSGRRIYHTRFSQENNEMKSVYCKKRTQGAPHSCERCIYLLADTGPYGIDVGCGMGMFDGVIDSEDLESLSDSNDCKEFREKE